MLKKIALAALVAIGTFAAPLAHSEPFNIIALGDMPYGNPKRSFPLYEKLISAINKRNPAMVVHIGDTKSGGTPCSDEMLNSQLTYLNTFESATLYTPGDNEWTDCYRKSAGRFDPLERLAYIRKTYFSKPETSFGKKPVAVESQAILHTEKYGDYPENIRLSKDGVHIILTHVVGSNNNFEVRDPDAAMEFFARNKANIAWLDDSFKMAIADNAKAVALFIHADMFEFDFNEFRKEGFLRHSGFNRFARALVKNATAFGKPVLLTYGDSHVHRVTRPFPKTAPNITAMEVYGARDMHAVEINIDSNDPAVFGFRTVRNPAQ